MPRVAIVGLGAVGSRVVEMLRSGSCAELVVYDSAPSRTEWARERWSSGVGIDEGSALDAGGVDVVVNCAPGSGHVEASVRAASRGASVVSVSDRISDVRSLLELSRRVGGRGVSVVPGAAFSPGVTCALSRHLAESFEHVEEIHVARDGAGGPACARQRHRALKALSLDWSGSWVRRPGGSGRELVWFPGPAAGADCYRAALPEALLLQPAFPHARRITARLSATRRDRLTSWLPMLSPPPADGGVGAVRVELRGRVGAAFETRIAGAVARPSLGAAAMAVVATEVLLGQGPKAEAAAAGAKSDEVPAVGISRIVDLATPDFVLSRLRHHGVELYGFERVG